MNVFIRPNICEFFQSKYICTFIRDCQKLYFCTVEEDDLSSCTGAWGRGWWLACFILHDDIFPTLQLIIICYETEESVRKKKLSLPQ